MDPAEREGTSHHLRSAAEGDERALAWLIERFSPFLRLQVECRLRQPLRGYVEPEDVVSDVWLATLPRIGGLVGSARTLKPALMAFLSTTVLLVVNNLYRKHIRGKPLRVPIDALGEGTEGCGAGGDLAKTVTGAITHAARSEVREAIDRCLARLSDDQKVVFVHRGIEGFSNSEVAEMLGREPNTVAKTYARAIESLLECLPKTLVDDVGPFPER